MFFVKALLAVALCAGSTLCAPTPTYVNCKTFKVSDVNLRGWLMQEPVIDPTFWNQNCGDAPDEWSCCQKLGSQCGPVLEERFATFITPGDIDKFAARNVNVLRIPTSYAVWVKVPNSKYYSGNQVSFLRKIANYAISKYNMHIIIDIHSLPGGVNGMGSGEAESHFGWFNNATNLEYSYRVVDAALAFIQSSGSPQSFTLEPINEAVDNPNPADFGTPAALSDKGAQYLLNYIKNVIARAKAINPQIPIMFQASYRPQFYFRSNLAADSNLVFDILCNSAGGQTGVDMVSNDSCTDDNGSATGSPFPVVTSDWSIQAVTDN